MDEKLVRLWQHSCMMCCRGTTRDGNWKLLPLENWWNLPQGVNIISPEIPLGYFRPLRSSGTGLLMLLKVRTKIVEQILASTLLSCGTNYQRTFLLKVLIRLGCWEWVCVCVEVEDWSAWQFWPYGVANGKLATVWQPLKKADWSFSRERLRLVWPVTQLRLARLQKSKNC